MTCDALSYFVIATDHVMLIFLKKKIETQETKLYKVNWQTKYVIFLQNLKAFFSSFFINNMAYFVLILNLYQVPSCFLWIPG